MPRSIRRYLDLYSDSYWTLGPLMPRSVMRYLDLCSNSYLTFAPSILRLVMRCLDLCCHCCWTLSLLMHQSVVRCLNLCWHSCWTLSLRCLDRLWDASISFSSSRFAWFSSFKPEIHSQIFLTPFDCVPKHELWFHYHFQIYFQGSYPKKL